MASRLVSKRSLGVDSKPVVPWGKDEMKSKKKSKPRKGASSRSKVSKNQKKVIGGLPSY